MVSLVLKIYDWMAGHRAWCFLLLLAVTALMLVLVGRLGFKEDISDFLPLDERGQQELSMYQDISGASRVVAIFGNSDSPDSLVEAIQHFVATLEERDTTHMVSHILAETDLSLAEQTAAFVYDNIPYFLEPEDYQRMDSLLSSDGYIPAQLQADREMLMFPTGSFLSENIQRDPLNLFSPVMNALQHTPAVDFEIYEGYIFTPDMKRALVIMESSFGNSETEGNARLLDLLQACAEATTSHLSVTFTGGPVIAVGNARQIKTDSVLSVSIAVALILLLLYFSLRRVRHLLLIALAIGWGWLFALAALSVFHSEVSIIVVGISSVIVGIAVNYPLHVISHLRHTPDVRQTLREIAKPLVVGNITTVGAFLALIPLQSVALRDLGLFSSFLLMGTILFTLLWMPHFVSLEFRTESLEFPTGLQRGSRRTIDSNADSRAVARSKLSVLNSSLLILLTLFFGYHSLSTTFDTDLSHINYMTDEQKADMAMLSEQGGAAASLTQQDPHFLLSDSIQRQRLDRWRSWVSTHRDMLQQRLDEEGTRAGFAEGSFDGFCEVLATDYQPQPLNYFRSLPPSLLMQNIDVKGLNSSLLNSLSDNFNYIGLACGCIVFFFLWLSFRSLFLAVLSFLPMAISWLWILGIMSLFGIQFNIVNIILATFIFGQGDDYTIFMTEGTVYEYVHRRRMLASYKRAILLSALIMFIGIGSLIVARHPALHSLAEVTIVGMFSVVLMAFTIPPMVFRWFVRYRKVFNIKKSKR